MKSPVTHAEAAPAGRRRLHWALGGDRFVLVYLCWKVQGVESSVPSKENPGVLEVPDTPCQAAHRPLSVSGS